MSSTRPYRHEGGLVAFYRRWVEWASARPTRATQLLLIALLPALVLTVQFFSHVQAGLQELLPRSSPSVRALEQIHARLGGQSHLTIIAQSPSPEQNRRFIGTLADRLRERNLPEARSIQGDVKVERKWIKDHAPLLIPKEQFDSLMDELDESVRKVKAGANPFYADLEESETLAQTWERLQKKFDQELRTHDRFPNGFFETPDGKTVVAVVWLQGSEVDLEPSANLLGAVQAEVAALKPKFPADLRVAYNGEVPNLVEEHDAILADLSLSSVLVFVLVGGLITAYFRSSRAVFAVLFGLVPGLLFAFAIGRLSVGHLNSNTAFLGSIIAGNGINYPLLFLAFYRARSPGEDRAAAIFAAARNALPGTLGAAVTASAAYGGLAASSFKGFSQFGWIGGVGMIATWLCTYLAMPIAIAWLNPPRQGERPTRVQGRMLGYFSHRHLPYLVAAGFVIASLAFSGLGIRHGLRQGLYEMDLQTLRNRDSLRTGSGSWDAKMNELFGVWLNPIAALVDDPNQREVVAVEYRRLLLAPELNRPAAAERVETIAGLVRPIDEQEERIARLAKLKKEIEGVPREEIPEKARPMIDEFRSFELRTITANDVPATLRHGFTEAGGMSDRVVLIYPSLQINYNDGRNILHFADRLADAKLPPDAVVGGGFLFMGEIIRLVRNEAPGVVLAVCLLVALVLLPIFFRQPLRIPLVVATVGIVAVSAQAIMLALGVQLNMLNFAAVPITIGVGSDYVVNLLGAMNAFRVDARRACARMGGAILLCSMTTVIGYVSLLVAQSGALRTFGWAAVLGELMAVVTVLLVLPVVMRRREAHEQESIEPQSAQASNAA